MSNLITPPWPDLDVGHLQPPAVVPRARRQGQTVAPPPGHARPQRTLVPALEDDLPALRDVLPAAAQKFVDII